MARFYSNENFPLPAVLELRGLGHDVLTTAESGHAGQQMTDSEVLAYAISVERAVLTYNRRHFVALHQQRPAHAGIIVCTVDADCAAPCPAHPRSSSKPSERNCESTHSDYAAGVMHGGPNRR